MIALQTQAWYGDSNAFGLPLRYTQMQCLCRLVNLLCEVQKHSKNRLLQKEVPSCRSGLRALYLYMLRLNLQAWLDTTSQYVKLLDSNHLVGVGIEGFFGNSTPSLLDQNPKLAYWMTVGNGANPAPYAPICEGQDFKSNHDLEVTA